MISYYELLKILIPAFCAMNGFTFWLVRRLVNGFERRTNLLYEDLRKDIKEKAIEVDKTREKDFMALWQAISKLQETVLTEDKHRLICRDVRNRMVNERNRQ